MTKYWYARAPLENRPRVLGLTASPIDETESTEPSKEMVEEKLASLENSVNALAWSRPVPLGRPPHARHGASLTLLGRTIFVFGGCGEAACTDELRTLKFAYRRREAYDPSRGGDARAGSALALSGPPLNDLHSGCSGHCSGHCYGQEHSLVTAMLCPGLLVSACGEKIDE